MDFHARDGVMRGSAAAILHFDLELVFAVARRVGEQRSIVREGDDVSTLFPFGGFGREFIRVDHRSKLSIRDPRLKHREREHDHRDDCETKLGDRFPFRQALPPNRQRTPTDFLSTGRG